MSVSALATEIIACGVYVVKYDRYRMPRVAMLERLEPDIFGYNLTLPGGKPEDRCLTDRRVKFRVARGELREEVNIIIKDSDLMPAREKNPSRSRHKGIALNLYTYLYFLPNHKSMTVVETDKFKEEIKWFDLPDFFDLHSKGLIHPALVEGWWWKIAIDSNHHVSENKRKIITNTIVKSLTRKIG